MIRRTGAHAAAVTVALACALAACSSIAEPPEIVTLEAALQPADGVADPITGTVAMIIRERETQIGIGVRGGVEGTRFGWMVRNGPCGGAGERVGPASAFAPIELEEDGEGAAETTLFRRVSVESTYAAEVFADAEGTGPVQACADLVPGD